MIERDVLLMVIGAFAGWAVTAAGGLVKQALRSKIRASRIDAGQRELQRRERKAILVLDRGYPAYREADITTRAGGGVLRVAPPPARLATIRASEALHAIEVQPFAESDAVQLLGATTWDQLGHRVGVADLAELVDRAREETADEWLSRYGTLRPFFNREKYGVQRITLPRAPNVRESNSIGLRTYVTDHFTYIVFKKVMKALRRRGESFVHVADVDAFNDAAERLAPFLTSFGVNALIVLRGPAGQRWLPIGKRSGRIDPNDAARGGRWHVPMNEGLTATDTDPGGHPSLRECLVRGLNEECNVELAKSDEFAFTEMFLVEEPFEIGAGAVVWLDRTLEDFREHMEQAKDYHLEFLALDFLLYDKLSIREFLASHDETVATPVLRYLLSALIVHELPDSRGRLDPGARDG